MVKSISLAWPSHPGPIDLCISIHSPAGTHLIFRLDHTDQAAISVWRQSLRIMPIYRLYRIILQLLDVVNLTVALL